MKWLLTKSFVLQIKWWIARCRVSKSLHQGIESLSCCLVSKRYRFLSSLQRAKAIELFRARGVSIHTMMELGMNWVEDCNEAMHETERGFSSRALSFETRKIWCYFLGGEASCCLIKDLPRLRFLAAAAKSPENGVTWFLIQGLL